MTSRAWLVSSLLLGSGFCGLVYQVVWLRELRLVFGASTMASAAVLAIFMGGLGFGGFLLGRVADHWARPLRLYANLELWIAVTASITPFLIAAVGRLYVMSGGLLSLGVGGATTLRVLLSTLVLGTTTFLMGGTLPAASRAVATEKDVGRRSVAILYGVNTLGGMIGVLLPTFVLFERVGVHATLWSVCLLNALIALAARRMSARMPEQEPDPDRREAGARSAISLPPSSLVLFAAAAVGFAFLLMELVWYRMLGPILGGSTYTFGLILAVVLLGIGSGGVLYAVAGRRRAATLNALAVVCAIEALVIAIPYALGDRIAVAALVLQPPDTAGFLRQVAAWALITSLVVLPAAIVAGYQFPLLIALLGRGRTSIGRQVGLGYVWNTIGAIAGSLAGGFGLMQVLTAPGTWKAVVGLLLGISVAFVLGSRRIEKRTWRLLPAALATLVAAALVITADGPTAAWRHAPIGMRRVSLPDLAPNTIRRWMNETRQSTLWEAEGRESSVALQSLIGLSFTINGKSDGSARYDAPTQVMCGLVGAVLHRRPESALVIGLGTGSTAGWLAEIPSVRRVDVAEIEPAIVEVARACRPVNCDALSGSKMTTFLGDGREMLLTARSGYDLIASEPSNPFRAGIASLFTHEFYLAARARLNSGGIFLQWVQAYEVDHQTVRTIYATLASVFDHVETWQTGLGDLLLVCSEQPPPRDPQALRMRIAEEPFRSALAHAWRVTDLEGFLSRLVASASYARVVAREEGGGVNTDDHPLVEFGFARTIGRTHLFDIGQIRHRARELGMHRPELSSPQVDWAAVEDYRLSMYTLEEELPPLEPHLSPDQRLRAEAQIRYLQADYSAALRLWESQGSPREPRGLVEIAMVADLLARAGRDDALPWIDALASHEPTEAKVLRATYLWSRGQLGGAASVLAEAFEEHRVDPWPWPFVMKRALSMAQQIAFDAPEHAPRLLGSLMAPFSVRQLEYARVSATMQIARLLGPEPLIRSFEAAEPHFRWQEDILRVRAELYRTAGHPLARRAAEDLRDFTRNARGPRTP